MRTIQSELYKRILTGTTYDDLLETAKAKSKLNEMFEKIERYRPIEARDMSAAHRAKVTGLNKWTCREFNRVYTQCKCT